ncbi:MAG: hypothetical protein ACFNQF_07745, partial [Bacteroides sp.]
VPQRAHSHTQHIPRAVLRNFPSLTSLLIVSKNSANSYLTPLAQVALDRYSMKRITVMSLL